jgi:hypothetical protein
LNSFSLYLQRDTGAVVAASDFDAVASDRNELPHPLVRGPVYSPRMSALPDITLSPFLALVLALVIPGALTILLAALLWTRRT